MGYAWRLSLIDKLVNWRIIVVEGASLHGQYEWFVTKALPRTARFACVFLSKAHVVFAKFMFECFIGRMSGMATQCNVKRNDNIGIFGINRVEWCITSWANMTRSYRSVAVYDTFGEEAVEQYVGVEFSVSLGNVYFRCGTRHHDR